MMIITNSVYSPLSGEILPEGGIRLSCALELPVGSGEVRLTTTDPRVQPYFNYRYLVDSWDRQRLREALRLCIQLLEHEAYKDIIDERITPTDQQLASDEALDVWMLENVSPARHISGTCKMGPASDHLAVVDQYCRVHRLEGLRVSDTSAMPHVTRANSNATAILIGERVADWVK